MIFCVLGLLVCVLLRNVVVAFCWFVLSVGPLSTICCVLRCFYLCCCSCVAAVVCSLVRYLMSFCVLMCFVNVAFFVGVIGCLCVAVVCYACLICVCVCRVCYCVVFCLFGVCFFV